jgi:hypothetical protein
VVLTAVVLLAVIWTALFWIRRRSRETDAGSGSRPRGQAVATSHHW